jgi:hypothetical protein
MNLRYNIYETIAVNSSNTNMMQIKLIRIDM